MKDDFISMASHELRAPINTIHTCVELALAGSTSPGGQMTRHTGWCQGRVIPPVVC